MSKLYFQKYEWIEEAENAKTLSYFSTKKNSVFSNEIMREFKYILENHEDRFRLSLHNKWDDDLHCMVIAMKKNCFVYPHKHLKSESYQIIQGKALLLYFNDLGEVEQTTTLSPEDGIIALVKHDTYHALISLEDTIYHETRLGPFISQSDSIFANWIVGDKDKYMENLANKVLKEERVC